MLMTLAGKHKSTVAKIARKYKASIDTPGGPRTCFQVTVQRDQGRKPLVARFGGIPLTRKRTAVMTDLKPIMATVKRNELIHRLLAGRCELCEGRIGLQVHHIRKLADLNKPGRSHRAVRDPINLAGIAFICDIWLAPKGSFDVHSFVGEYQLLGQRAGVTGFQ